MKEKVMQKVYNYFNERTCCENVGPSWHLRRNIPSSERTGCSQHTREPRDSQGNKYISTGSATH